ncbi:MAG: hypothetical protein WD341_06275 [Tistlia sp.]|uniref:helix-turn-helix transcriptional regulator n=1 Tax=Tistlia sp. TaxID=3057121 RepID=UPI0034A45562
MTLAAAEIPLPPPDKLCLSQADVAALIGISYNQVEACVAAGLLPEPLTFGKRCRRWYRPAVVALLDRRAGLADAAASHDEAASRVQEWRSHPTRKPRPPSERPPFARPPGRSA